VFAVAIECDTKYTVLSNMPEQSVTHLNHESKLIQFMDSPKMSSYLLAIIVAEFD